MSEKRGARLPPDSPLSKGLGLVEQQEKPSFRVALRFFLGGGGGEFVPGEAHL